MSRIFRRFSDWQVNSLANLFRKFGMNEDESAQAAYDLTLIINVVLFIYYFLLIGAVLWNHMIDVVQQYAPVTQASPDVETYGSVGDVIGGLFRGFFNVMGFLGLFFTLVFAFNFDAILTLAAVIISIGTVMLAAVVVLVELVRTRRLGRR